MWAGPWASSSRPERRGRSWATRWRRPRRWQRGGSTCSSRCATRLRCRASTSLSRRGPWSLWATTSPASAPRSRPFGTSCGRAPDALREAYGRKVVSTDDAETIGRLDAFVIDAEQRSVVGLRLAKVRGDRPFLSWSDLQGFGNDAVTVPGASVLRDASGEAEERAASKRSHPIGKSMLSGWGRVLGTVPARHSYDR